MRVFSRSRLAALSVLACALAVVPGTRALAADHSDTALLNLIGRANAQFTDFHTFVRDGRLVLAVAMNPAIPVSASTYQFPADLTVDIAIDNDSPVSFDDPQALATYGGTILDPAGIEEDIVFRITFDAAGNHTVEITADGGDDDEDDDEGDDEVSDSHGRPTRSHSHGSVGQPSANAHPVFGGSDDDDDTTAPIGFDPSSVEVFVGLRDDPFIRCPRAGRNIGAIVIEVPLAEVLEDQSTLVIWATSRIDDVNGPCQEIFGRSLRSMFPENDLANTYHPSEHTSKLGIVPDVTIYDTSRPAVYPNGRELLDDVVAIVADPRVVNTCPPLPNGNDLPFLSGFPYLSAPHPPVN